MDEDYMDKNKTTSSKRILIIGGVAAGTSAASKARRMDPSADIKILQDEYLVSYGSCGFPYVIEGVVDNFDKLIVRSVDEFKNRYNIEIITNTNATRMTRLETGTYNRLRMTRVLI